MQFDQCEIRQATIADCEEITLLFENAKSDWDEKTLGSAFADQEMQLVLMRNKKILGYLAYREIVDHVDLLQIVVDPSMQRQGIATRLLAMLFEKTALPIALEVRASNVKAIALYEKVGFQKVGLRKRYYRDGEDAVLMNRRPSEAHPVGCA